jgi:hypothetical protein
LLLGDVSSFVISSFSLRLRIKSVRDLDREWKIDICLREPHGYRLDDSVVDSEIVIPDLFANMAATSIEITKNRADLSREPERESV